MNIRQLLVCLTLVSAAAHAADAPIKNARISGASSITGTVTDSADTTKTGTADFSGSTFTLGSSANGDWPTFAGVNADGSGLYNLSASQVGLDQVNNTSDADKPVSTAQATANTSDRARANHTGTQSADTITDGTTNKAYTAAEKTKLSGIAAGTTAESYGAATGASAATNTTAIQNALNVGGTVTLLTAGTYSINNTLTIGSNTRFILGSGVTVKMTGGTLHPMLVTSAYTAGNLLTGASPNNITLSGAVSTTLVTGTWTAHGLSVGDYVWINNVTPSMYCGVFCVESVADANTFTFNTLRVPTAAATAVSGSIHAVKANVNISIEGGAWDADQATNTSVATTPDRILMFIGGVANSRVEGVTFKNANKFCLNIGAVNTVAVRNVSSPVTNSDIVKVYGPAFNGSIDGLTAIAGDDVVSLHTKESPAYSGYIWTFGDVLNWHVRNINGKGPINLGTVFCSPNEYADNIEFDGLSGSVTGYGGYLSTESDYGANGKAGRITFRNLSARASANFLCDNTTYAQLNILGLTANVKVTSQPISITTGDANSEVNIDQFACDLSTAVWPTSTVYAIGLTGTIGKVNVTRSRCYSGGSVRFIDLGSVTQHLSVKDNIVNSGDTLVRVESTATGTPMISISGNQSNQAAIANCSASCNLSVVGNHITDAYNAVLRTSGSLMHNISMSGNVLDGSSVVQTITSGTPTIKWNALKGTTTNDDAAAGDVGELLPATIASGSAVSLTTATATNVTSKVLTSGDWDVWGVVDYVTTGATTTDFKSGISTTSATFGAQDTFQNMPFIATALSDTFGHAVSAVRVSVPIGSTSTVYLLGQSNFSVGTATAYGSIYARRRR